MLMENERDIIGDKTEESYLRNKKNLVKENSKIKVEMLRVI